MQNLAIRIESRIKNTLVAIARNGWATTRDLGLRESRFRELVVAFRVSGFEELPSALSLPQQDA